MECLRYSVVTRCIVTVTPRRSRPGWAWFVLAGRQIIKQCFWPNKEGRCRLETCSRGNRSAPTAGRLHTFHSDGRLGVLCVCQREQCRRPAMVATRFTSGLPSVPPAPKAAARRLPRPGQRPQSRCRDGSRPGQTRLVLVPRAFVASNVRLSSTHRKCLLPVSGFRCFYVELKVVLE